MTYEEAMAWLRGTRSSRNYADTPESADRRDAALTEQAYWTVRAHKEGLVDSETN